VTVVDNRVDELRRRLQRDPGSRLFAQLAEELRKAGDVQEAIDVARAGLETHPSYASARLTLGRALLDSGDPAGARAELETAVREAPDNILASRLLGEALETLGDLGEALARYRTTLEIAPGDKHVEARLRAIQERFAGQGPAPAEGHGRAPEVTKPMSAVRPAGVGETAAAGGGGVEVPPTVRLRTPAEGQGEARAPLPPTGGGAEGEEGRRFGALDEPLPPTLPMGVVVSQDARQGSGRSPAEPPGRGAEIVGTVDAGFGTETADVGETAQEVGEGPSGHPGFELGQAEAAVPSVPRAESTPATTAAADPAQPPLSSATLAELYFQQGLLERAVEVYRQVLEEEPGNEAAGRRLAEIEKVVRESAADLPVPAPERGDDRAARRRALEGAIERLEALLVLVRRR